MQAVALHTPDAGIRVRILLPILRLMVEIDASGIVRVAVAPAELHVPVLAGPICVSQPPVCGRQPPVVPGRLPVLGVVQPGHIAPDAEIHQHGKVVLPGGHDGNAVFIGQRKPLHLHAIVCHKDDLRVRFIPPLLIIYEYQYRLSTLLPVEHLTRYRPNAVTERFPGDMVHGKAGILIPGNDAE